MPSHRLRHPAVLTFSLTCAVALASDKPPPAPAPAQAPEAGALQPETLAVVKQLLAPATMSVHARNTLRQKMKNHGGDWRELSAAIVLLSYADVEGLAQRIAIEPRISEEAGHTLGLGQAFFTLQEELRTRARGLREAAVARNPRGVAQSFGKIAETCASCHAIYREPPEKAPGSIRAAQGTGRATP